MLKSKLQATTVALASNTVSSALQQDDLAKLIKDVGEIESMANELNTKVLIYEMSAMKAPSFSSM